MYDIKRLCIYGKDGLHFLDYDMPKNPQGLYVYLLPDRGSVMIECIWKGVYKDREGIYAKAAKRKLAQIEILNRWIPTLTKMIAMITGGESKPDKQLDQQREFREIGV